ncbi:MAG: dimethyl sulfoxide reductase anchor subunit [Actinomycetaceae bacterium]|nr:dimethyl sulfoxide reductase anchor subunit [Actinomycetaceae bacterium]
MHWHEWPLTVFTILGQMAVGAFLTLGFINVLGRRRFNDETVDRVADPALYAIGPVMVAALLASIFHLGNPLNAPNALRHVATSWLSREIVSGASFAAFGFAFAALLWLRWFSTTLRTALAVLTAVVGVAFIWVMASVYMLPTVPAWNHWTTPAQFYLSAVIMGTMAIAVAFTSYPLIARRWPQLDRWVRGYHAEPSSYPEEEVEKFTRALLRVIGIVVIVAIALQLIVLIMLMMRGQTSPNPPAVAFPMGWFIVRLALLTIGAGLMGAYIATTAKREPAFTQLWLLATTSFVLVTVSELIGRFIFYGTMNRIGI